MIDSESPSSGLNEVASILAAGFVRVLERKSSQNLHSEAKTPLDCGRASTGDIPIECEDIAP